MTFGLQPLEAPPVRRAAAGKRHHRRQPPDTAEQPESLRVRQEHASERAEHQRPCPPTSTGTTPRRPPTPSSSTRSTATPSGWTWRRRIVFDGSTTYVSEMIDQLSSWSQQFPDRRRARDVQRHRPQGLAARHRHPRRALDVGVLHGPAQHARGRRKRTRCSSTSSTSRASTSRARRATRHSDNRSLSHAKGWLYVVADCSPSSSAPHVGDERAHAAVQRDGRPVLQRRQPRRAEPRLRERRDRRPARSEVARREERRRVAGRAHDEAHQRRSTRTTSSSRPTASAPRSATRTAPARSRCSSRPT